MNYHRITIALLVLFLSIIISGCGDKGTDSESPSPTSTPSPTESSTPEASETPSVTLLQEFKEQSLANVPADEMMGTLKQMLEEVSAAEADEFIRTLEAYYETNLPVVEKQYEAENIQRELSDLDWPFTESQIPNIKDESVRGLVKQTLAGGYKLETTEGYIFPVVDYSKLMTFSDKVTTAMQTYLDLMAMESNEKTASDGGLVISLEELTRRTLAAESYVITFPDTAERMKVEDRFIQYLNYYLVGLNNTPIFDYETFILLPEVKAQFEQMVESHSETVVGQLTKQMLTILSESSDAVFAKNKQGEQTDIQAMKKFRDELEAIARSKLPKNKK